MSRIVKHLKFSDGAIVNKLPDLIKAFSEKDRLQDIIRMTASNELENILHGF